MYRNLIDDYTYDRWAKELYELQRDNPIASKNVAEFYDEFADWTGETGSHLPVRDKWIVQRSWAIYSRFRDWV